MTEMDARPFFQNLTVLAEVFDAKFSEAKQMLYFEALSDLPLEAVLKAMKDAAQTCRFMPRPVEIRDRAVGSAEDAAEKAWALLHREVRRVGSHTTPNLPSDVAEAMRMVWGTWVNLCETLPNDGPELLGWVKRFKSVYVMTQSEERRANQITEGTKNYLRGGLKARLLEKP